MSVKMIAFDLDGTVVSHHHRVHPQTKQALKMAQDHGLKIVVASGRHFKSMTRILKKLGLTKKELLLVTQNAAEVMVFDHTGKLTETKEHFFSFAESSEVFDLANKYGVTLFAYTNRKNLAYSNRRLSAFVWIMRHNSQRRVSIWEKRKNAVQMSKIIAFGSGKNIEDFCRELKERNYSVFAFSEFHQGRKYVEISPPGVNKKEGVKYFADKYHISSGEVMYFGDGENDIEAIKWAGLGVAMGNAKPHVKEVADIVTDSVGDLGVAKQIFKVLAQQSLN